MNKQLILIDGSSYFFRAFHALPPLLTTKGQATGAIYGVVNMVKRLLKDRQPTHMVVVFDAKGKTFRDDWYPAYKAHRPPTPPELSSQFEPLQSILSAMGLAILTIPGVEADDVIGTLALQGTQQAIPVLISTGDKDMAQLVNANVTLINTMSDQMLDETGVMQKFGVTPEQMIDYLTLVGDTSDNIPGVHKCGPKTAVKWLETYGTLDQLIEHADDIGGKIGEHLRASLTHIPLSKRLITIKTDVDLPLKVNELWVRDPDSEQLQHWVKELEFKNWVFAPSAVKATPEPVKSIPEASCIINTEPAWMDYLAVLKSSTLICVKTQTTNKDAMSAALVGIAINVPNHVPVYIPLAHEDPSPQLAQSLILADLKPILEDSRIAKIGQNLKHDDIIFKQYGISLQGISADTMLESYVLTSAGRRHDLESLASKYLNRALISLTDIAGRGVKQLSFEHIPIYEAASYAAEEVSVILQLHQVLYPLLSEPLRQVLQDIEIPLISILADIERQGVLIDKDLLLKHGVRLKAQLVDLEQRAIALAGKPFNLNSPKQLQTILFEELKLPIRSKTPTGQASTSEAILQELANEYELPSVILTYRSLSKLVSTYIDALPKKINPKTGRVHTSYNQAVTATGRLSSSEPNLQNIPIRTEEGRLIRRAFIAPKQQVLLTADYSQIELRIMAHVSQDPQLIAAFSAGLDIHTATAAEIAGIPIDAVSSDMRRKAKAINFGLIYGMSAFGLAKQLGIDRQEAQRYIDCYFNRYPGVLAYMERTRHLAHQQGYVETIFGRRLDLPDIKAQAMQVRKAAERAAINAPLQGTAADIIKKAMISVATWQKQSAPYVTMIMQVHDELVFEVREEALEDAKQTIKTLMESVAQLSVPLLVSMGTGQNWDEAH